MEKKFTKSKLAVAVGSAALALAMSAPANAVVVVGGDNGWEVSFDGNVNLFYNYWDQTVKGTMVGPGATVNTPEAKSKSSHLNEGLLPAFFSFNAKSPTVNGLTGTARISFAPDSSSAKTTRQNKGGNSIDMREVMASVNGSFGTISFGRTLGLFGRQAILKDQTLFGVGAPGSINGGGTTLGRIGYGYIYPEFRTRFSYETPVYNGFQVTVAMFDPQTPTDGTAGNYETSKPQFQGEATYATTFANGGALNVWVDGLWQDMKYKPQGDTVTSWGVDAGGEGTYMNFQLVGHYYTGQALGNDLFMFGTTGIGTGAIGGAAGFGCGALGCRTADNNGWYVQGGYTFMAKTKVAVSYGESRQDAAAADATGIAFNEAKHRMWTIGVYHDVNSWLKLVAEYNNYKDTTHNVAGTELGQLKGDGYSVGAFMTW
jgi:hypothetical protein